MITRKDILVLNEKSFDSRTKVTLVTFLDTKLNNQLTYIFSLGVYRESRLPSRVLFMITRKDILVLNEKSFDSRTKVTLVTFLDTNTYIFSLGVYRESNPNRGLHKPPC